MSYARKLFAPLAAAAVFAALATPAFAAPSGESLSASASAKKPPLSAKLEACTGDGYATFAGTMPAWGARARMEMRFDLQQKVIRGGRGWTALKGIPSFGVWDGADPGVPGFIVRKRVGGLLPGNAYRAVVRFRWRNPRGKTIRAAKRITSRCELADQRPDLQLRNPDVVRGNGGEDWTYRAFVVNTGKGPAGASEVTLVFGKTSVVYNKSIPPLAAGARALVEIKAPRCESGDSVTFTADYTALVAEAREDNNVLARRCAAR
jgi:hypothetical protein